MMPPDALRAAVPALEQLSDVAMRRLAQAADERRFATGAVLYRAGTPADALWIVLAGRVRVERPVGATRRAVLHSEEAGGVLGEIPVFGGGPYPATAIATQPTRCARVDAAALERLLAESPEIARFALRRLAARAQSLLRRIDDLHAHTVTARVAAALLARARSARGTSFTLGASQQALADELGTAREVVVRSLGALCEAGAVRRVGRARFALARASVLEAIAEGK